MRGMGTIRRTVRRLQGLAPGPLVLMYHRVIDLPPAPHNLCVSPQHFQQQLEVLKKSYRVIGLTEAAEALARDRPLSHLARTIVITFDDGYADNLHNAEPLLERYECPVTVFVASGFVGSKRQFWWDEL